MKPEDTRMKLDERIHALVFNGITKAATGEHADDAWMRLSERERFTRAVVDELRAGNIEFRLGGLALLAEAAEAADLSDNARREIAHLTQFAADVRHDPAERTAALLTAHQRWDVGGCLCGWSQLGMSHALHQADVLTDAGLLADARPSGETEGAPDA